jgi:hypothetical protein
MTSNGRCTQGCFASILKVDQEVFKYFCNDEGNKNDKKKRLIVIDTEGFGSEERK